MALTVALTATESMGSVTGKIMRLTPDASYPTGGYTFSASTAGLNRLYGVAFLAVAAGYIPQWDRTNGKIKLYWTGAGLSAAVAEVTNATNASACVMEVLALGK